MPRNGSDEGSVISLVKGTRVVYKGEEEETEVVFVTYVQVRGAPKLVQSLGVGALPVRRGA